ncbi:MAG: RNB domain-containing ribonuclease [Solirubrobacteraceae bacterium]|nr:RNB domain-containing ribonuclease [Solirubrobacteraceae bacterium]
MSGKRKGGPKGKSGKGRGPAPKPPKQGGAGPKRSGRHGGRGSGSTGRGVNESRGEFRDRDDVRGPRSDRGRDDFRGPRDDFRGPRDDFRGPRDEVGADPDRWRSRDRGAPRRESVSDPRGRGRDFGRPAPRGRDFDRSAPRGRDSDRPAPRGRQDSGNAFGDGPPVRRGPRRREDGGQVCVVARNGKFLVAEPFFMPGDRLVLGRGGNVDGIEEGELVLVIPEDDFGGSWRIAERLGDPENTADVIAALLFERDCSRVHDEATLSAAAAAVQAPDPSNRRDLTGIPTFTIDPTTAKDFDDAISAEEGADGAIIRVHIADVTSFVEPGGVIDVAGRARATSTYVPGLVAPMLPPQLADDACSLVPGAQRRAVTIEMVVSAGRCIRAEVYRSTIKSDKRLDYDEVDQIFEGTLEAEDPWAGPLAIARRVAAELLAERPQALELDIPEPEFEFDPSGQVTSQRPSQHTESHKLIEQLMVLANEQVARILQASGAPGLFRIHERPEPSHAERLVDQLASLGIPVPPVPESMGPREASELVVECSKIIGATVRRAERGHLALPLLVLRALKIASYSPVNLGHAGLSLSHYCHFTSPIRRYPEIVCHRAVLALAEQGLASIGPDSGDRLAGSADTGRERDEDDPLTELAKHCSDQERASMAVEREADRIAKSFLLKDLLISGGHDRVWKGEVTGIIQAGLFVNFGGGFEGLIPLRSLRGDWWELNAEGTMLSAERSGATLHIGDPAEVIVDRIDMVRGKIDLRPIAVGGDLKSHR